MLAVFTEASSPAGAHPSMPSKSPTHTQSNAAGLAEHDENETPATPPATPAAALRLEGEATEEEEVKQEPAVDESPAHTLPSMMMMPIRFAVEGSSMLPQPLQDILATDADQAALPDEERAVKRELPAMPSSAAPGPSHTFREEDGAIVISDSEDDEPQPSQGGGGSPHQGQDPTEQEDCDGGGEDHQVSEPGTPDRSCMNAFPFLWDTQPSTGHRNPMASKLCNEDDPSHGR